MFVSMEQGRVVVGPHPHTIYTLMTMIYTNMDWLVIGNRLFITSAVHCACVYDLCVWHNVFLLKRLWYL